MDMIVAVAIILTIAIHGRIYVRIGRAIKEKIRSWLYMSDLGRDGLSCDPLGVTLDIIRAAIEKLEEIEQVAIDIRGGDLDLDNPEDDRL